MCFSGVWDKLFFGVGGGEVVGGRWGGGGRGSIVEYWAVCTNVRIPMVVEKVKVLESETFRSCVSLFFFFLFFVHQDLFEASYDTNNIVFLKGSCRRCVDVVSSRSLTQHLH